MKFANRRYWIVAVAIAVVVVCGLDVSMYLKDHHRSQTNTTSPSPTPTATVTPGEVQPFVTIINKNIPIDNNKVSTSIQKGVALGGTGHKLSIKNVTLTSHSDPCSVQSASDVCFVGQGTDSTKANFSVYYLKDAVHSRLFDYASNFSQAQVSGTLASATMTLNSDKNENALVLINQDASGWLILSTNSDLSEMTNLSHNVVAS